MILPRLALIALAATIAAVAASGVAASTAGAKAIHIFPELKCEPSPIRVGEPTSCVATIGQATDPNRVPTGTIVFFDSRNTGTFSPETCLLERVTPFSSSCSATFTAHDAGGRFLSFEYHPNDLLHEGGGSGTQIKVFIPNSVRFAKPGGLGSEPCIVKATPCSLFKAASSQAPGTSIVPGAEVVLAPGTYSGTDFGPSGGFLTLESGITFRGEAGPRPLLAFSSGGLFASNSTISHIEISNQSGSAINANGGVVEEIIARGLGVGVRTCVMQSGVLRDSACLSSGFGASAVGAAVFTEHGEIFEPKLRNVTAISSGTQSAAVNYVVENDGPVAGAINVSASSVLAVGTGLDVFVQGTAVSGPPGSANVLLDHSDYRNAAGNGAGFITPAGTGSNITAFPQLADDSIHQLFNSPTIDKGATDGASGTIDIDGELRTQGGVPDIGADEITPPNHTETKLRCDVPSLIKGEGTHCTVTVTDRGDNGPTKPMAGTTVTFKDNTQTGLPSPFNPPACTLVRLSSTEADCNVEFRPTLVANHQLEATYPGDNGAHSPSAGTTALLVKPQLNTTETGLNCVASTLFTGETTTCTARVTDKAEPNPVSPMAGDVVTFADTTEPGKINPATCTLVAANSTEAICQTAVVFQPTALGPHALEASFPGDDKHVRSVGTLSVPVNQAPNETKTKLSCDAETLIVGETTHCTATVTDEADKGPARPLAGAIVTFTDGSQIDPEPFTPTTCVLDAISSTQARCHLEVDFDPERITVHNLHASFPADSSHLASSGNLSLQVKPQLNTTETELTCHTVPLQAGETAHCTVTVFDNADHNPASSMAGGVVTFNDATQTQPDPFNPATCTLVTSGPTRARCETEVAFHPGTIGEHHLEASFPGDEKHARSSGTLPVQVNGQPNTTKTELTCRATTLNSGETTHCAATVTDEADRNPASSMEGATVTFHDNTQPQPEPFAQTTCVLEAISSTRAGCETEVEFTPTTVTEHHLQASFPGDDNHVNSSGALTVKVKAQANHTETRLTCGQVPLKTDETTLCTATVTDKADNGPAKPLAGATVTFSDGTQIDPNPFTPTTCVLEAISTTQAHCQAEVEFHPTTVANHHLEASFPGDDNHVGTVGLLQVQVDPQPNTTKTELTCRATTLNTGETTHCTAEVTDEADHNAASSMAGDVVTFADLTQPGSITPTTCTLSRISSTRAGCETEVDFHAGTVTEHHLRASFPGDDSHVDSSGTLTEQVKAQANHTETTLTCSPASLKAGETTHCTATVTDEADHNPASSMAGDAVTFDDATEPESISPSTCTLVMISLTQAHCETQVAFQPSKVAVHQLEASFPGDDNHVGKVGVRSVQVDSQPNPNHTKTELTCRATTLNTGESTHCTAEVTDEADHNPASSMAGDVVTFADTTQPGSISPSCKLARISSTKAACEAEVEFTAGTVAEHHLQANFPGDGAHLDSFDAFTVKVKAQANRTETKLTCSQASLKAGEATQCTATVTDEADHNPASSMAGDVVAFNDSTEPESINPATCTLVTISSTRAHCQTEVGFHPTTAALHHLEASFPGDDSHVGTVGALSVQVDAVQPPPPPHTTKTTLVCNPTTLVLGAGPTQCTATVEDTAPAGSALAKATSASAAAADADHPGGEVKLDVVVGEGVLSAKSCDLPANGQVKVSCQVFTYTPSKAGAPELKASYQGDAGHASSSGTAKLTVSTPAPPPPPPPPAAPNTTLGKKPVKKTPARQALFQFSSDQAGSSFRCKLDKKAAKACRSPFKIKVLPGRHTFTVTAVNAQGVADPTPVVYQWTVRAAGKRRPKR